MKERLNIKRDPIPPSSIDQVSFLVTSDLIRVEAELAGVCSVLPHRVLLRISSDSEVPGANRILALLHLLAAKLSGGDGPRAVHIATTLELILAATRVHRDVVDVATSRHSSKKVRRNSESILSGDWLYVSSILPALELSNFRILQLLINVVSKLIEAEFSELEQNSKRGFEVVGDVPRNYDATASLFGLACQLGAVLGDSKEEEERRLAQYGLNFGYGFQLREDLLRLCVAPAPWGRGTKNPRHARQRLFQSTGLAKRVFARARHCLNAFSGCEAKCALQDLTRILVRTDVSTGPEVNHKHAKTDSMAAHPPLFPAAK